MTRRQKLILIILGILDVAVIALLGSAVVRSLPPTTPTVSPIAVQISPCEQKMLETFSTTPPFADGVPTVAWSNKQLHLSLHVAYKASVPPEDSAQYLWTALDSIAEIVQEGCTLPEKVTISIIAQGEAETHQFLVQLAGSDIKGWLAGALSDEALAALAHYRQTTQAAPQ